MPRSATPCHPDPAMPRRGGRHLAATRRTGALTMLLTGVLLAGGLLAVIALGHPAAMATVEEGAGWEAAGSAIEDPEPRAETQPEVREQPEAEEQAQADPESIATEELESAAVEATTEVQPTPVEDQEAATSTGGAQGGGHQPPSSAGGTTGLGADLA